MPELYSTTEVIYLGRELGRGGEGTVFEVIDKPELVAKIYHEQISDDKAEKLRQMVAFKNEKLLRLAAWVTDVLRDQPAGQIIGFLMPKINSGKAIHELYNPQSRRQHFPRADWRFLIHAAANLARAFAVIHAHNHAVADVNHGNVVIGRDATVRLIDCDSYHLNAPTKSFLCEVGVSTHTPPELQNHSLRDVVRTSNHDAFGLAVLIFQLLFMGRHPFSGTFQGAGENTLENSIAQRRFAYGDGAGARQIKQPPGTLPLAAVSAQVAKLFERAFLEIENRPSAHEWVVALGEMEQNLQPCAINTGHYYLQTLKKCPWCKLEGQTGVLFFPAKFTGNFESDGEFDLFTLGNLIDAIKPPELSQNLPALTQRILAPYEQKVPPSPFVTAALANYRTSLTVFLTITAVLVFVVGFLFGFGSIFWMGFVGYWILSEIVKSILKIPQEKAQLHLDQANQNWQNFKEDWRKTAIAKSFETTRENLKAKIKEHRELPLQKQAKLKEIEAQSRQQQLDFYLKGFLIKDAELSGLSDERLDFLTNNGIKTAAQIDLNSFPKTPLLTHAHKRILVEWRSGLEKKFVFNRSLKSIEETTEEIQSKIFVRRAQLEAELRGGLTGLQQVSVQLVKKQEELSLQSDQLATNLLQAESDFQRVADLKSHAIALLIAVSIISFVLGISIRVLTSFDSLTEQNSVSVSELSLESLKHEENKINLNPKQIHSLSPPIVSAEVPKNWGKQAQENFDQAEKCFAQANFQAAVFAYKKAIRANPKIARIYNKLGETYFQLAQYGEAVEIYQEALKIDEYDSDTWHKLGLVFNKINQPDSAIAAFKKAVENSLNADPSRYQLGLSYLYNQQPTLAQKQYELLDKMHSPLAEKLWRELEYQQNKAPLAPIKTGLVADNSNY